MRRVLVALVLCASCAAQMDRESRRWPDHRKIEEKRISDLESQVATLQLRLHELENELIALRNPPPRGDDAPPP